MFFIMQALKQICFLGDFARIVRRSIDTGSIHDFTDLIRRSASKMRANFRKTRIGKWMSLSLDIFDS